MADGRSAEVVMARFTKIGTPYYGPTDAPRKSLPPLVAKAPVGDEGPLSRVTGPRPANAGLSRGPGG